MSQTEPYVMVLEESVGGNNFTVQHIIEAEDEQKVKYHFHRTLKDYGFHDTQFDKHCLQGHNGLLTELINVRPLGNIEHQVLEKFLPSWTKV